MHDDPAVNDAFFFKNGARALAKKIGEDNFPRVRVSQFDREQNRTVVVEKPGLIVPVPRDIGEEVSRGIPSAKVMTMLEPDGTVSVLKPNGDSGAAQSFKLFDIDTIAPGTPDLLRIHEALDISTQAYLAKLNAEVTPPAPDDPRPNGDGSDPARLYKSDDTVAA